MLKKTLIWGGIAFLIFCVAFRPGIAVDMVRTLGDVFLYMTDLFAGMFS